MFCGRGNGMAALGRLGFTRVRGVDRSFNLLAGGNRGRPRIVGDCRDLPVAAASHDVVIVQGGLHHLPDLPGDLERVTAEAARVLKPGGLFVAIEPWQTPFLEVVHRIGCSRAGRRLSDKLDALATMIEHESITYHNWLRQPEVLRRVLEARFTPLIRRIGWGKLTFVGRAALPEARKP
jgi:SAM-dependent methyltransferase